MKNIIKKYTNGEITVVWQPHLCVHATTCFNELPKVFIPYERPWINMSGATTDEIINTVDRCPTDALTFFWNKENMEDQKVDEKETEISILKNGPIILKGFFKIKDIDGKYIECKKSVAICRCGLTKNTPYCDGAHKNDFKIDK